MNVLERIDALRQERGWSINNLAMEAMLTQSTLNNLYIRKSEPKLSTLRSICQAFGISLSEFFDFEDDEQDPNDQEPKEQRPNTDEMLSEIITKLTDEQKSALLILLRAVK